MANPASGERPHYRLLVVDDCETDWLLYQACLSASEAASYEPMWVADGASALVALQEQPFDCVMLDFFLPDQHGTELVQPMRELIADPDLPVILLTDSRDNNLITEAVHAEISDFLPKVSVSAQSLDRSIANAVGKAELLRGNRQRQAEIQRMNVELIQKNQEIEAFYQSVSHELKTPLTAIREYTSLVLDGIAGEISPEANEFLSQSLDCTDRLTRLVNDLFDAARIESGKLSLSKKPCDLGEIAACALKLLEKSRQTLGVNCKLHACPTLPAIEVDYDRILQVFTNLLTNALKFTPQHGAVDVSVKFDPKAGHLHCGVKDTGRGIADENLRRIFDRLYQTSEGDAVNHEGMGIGLHLCRNIVEIHGGRIWVESQLNEGAHFQFTLPLEAHHQQH